MAKKLLLRELVEVFSFDSEGLENIEGDINLRYSSDNIPPNDDISEIVCITYKEIEGGKVVERTFSYYAEDKNYRNVGHIEKKGTQISKGVVNKLYGNVSEDIKKLLPKLD